MLQQYIILAGGGVLILVLLFGVVRKKFNDFISVLFDLPDNSDERESQ